ncbi:MAG: hypothetical protein HC898_09595 [Phycisphaerales bacterium]|nr:hypothetical protein [Phycisphaerales bacterium]
MRVTYPKPSESKAPCPVILWSHGMFGSKDGYQPLVRYWASHGYIVIQPTHEDSLALGNTTFGDFASGSQYWKTRPVDVVFLLNSLGTIAEEVKGLPEMDKSKLAVGGHSFGAHTTMLLSGVQAKSNLRLLREEYDSFLEDRFVCTLMISPQGPGPMFTKKSYQVLPNLR